MEDKYKLFDITKEEHEKSKDILPTLDLGKMDINSKVTIKFLEKEPHLIKHKNKFKKEKTDPVEIETSIIKIFVDTLSRPDKIDGGFIEIPIQENHTLWLSSKSLRMGVLNLYTNHDENLEDVKAKIHIGITEYKEFGENRCYSVSEESKEIE